MRILHVVLHACVRAHKMAWLQREKGHVVHLATERILAQGFFKDYNATHLFNSGHLEGNPNPDMGNLQDLIHAIRDSIDIIHVHNEPDWPVGIIKEVAGKIPVVWDVHDMVSKRASGVVDEWEQKALDACDAVCTPSADYKQTMQKRTSKPVIEVLSCVPERLMPKARVVPILAGIVYEGGLKGKEKAGSDQFHWRSWKDVFGQLGKMNMPVYAYSSTNVEDFSEYASTIFLGPLRYDQLIKNLSAHECGITGSPFPDNPAFDGAMPNKLFEYMAAGIPQVVMNAPTAGQFVAGLGFGKEVASVEEIPQAMDEMTRDGYADYIWEARKNWTMEKQIQKTISLYQDLLGIPRSV